MATVVKLAVMVLDQEGRGRGQGAREGGVERMRRLLSGGHDLEKKEEKKRGFEMLTMPDVPFCLYLLNNSWLEEI